MKPVLIHGYSIDLDHDLLQAKNVKELKAKIELFTHLEGEEKDQAYDLLWKELHPNAKPVKEEVVKPEE